MEQWHQKLHNNTTPDDVAICEAYLNFLAGGGDAGAYWATLSDAGIVSFFFFHIFFSISISMGGKKRGKNSLVFLSFSFFSLRTKNSPGPREARVVRSGNHLRARGLPGQEGGAFGGPEVRKERERKREFFLSSVSRRRNGKKNQAPKTHALNFFPFSFFVLFSSPPKNNDRRYLGILKGVHSGADLSAAAAAVGDGSPAAVCRQADRGGLRGAGRGYRRLYRPQGG